MSNELMRTADSQFNKEKYAEALQLYTQNIQQDHKNAEAWYKRGQCKYELGNIAGAILDLTAALEADPDHTLARIKRAEYALRIWSADIGTAYHTFPEYYKQFGSLMALPKDARGFWNDACQIYMDRASAAETSHQLEDAILYWGYFCTVCEDFTHDMDAFQDHLEALKQRLVERSEKD